jgi:hypothetical protein
MGPQQLACSWTRPPLQCWISGEDERKVFVEKAWAGADHIIVRGLGGGNVSCQTFDVRGVDLGRSTHAEERNDVVVGGET